jgi:circadian clock protein KaiB
MLVSAKRKVLPRTQKTVVWDLRLYVADESPRSILAYNNLKNACEEHLSERYHIKVIDVIMHPEAARANQIVALPTVVRRSPTPVRTGIGDMTNVERLLDLLNRN